MDSRSILLVDDNPDDVFLTQRTLTRSRLANPLVVAKDGEEALRCLSRGDLPMLVLLDLRLPKIDGMEVLRRIRRAQLTEYLPVVILTSSDRDKDLLSSYMLGINGYICKPLDFPQFAAVVNTLGFSWTVLPEKPPTGTPHPADWNNPPIIPGSK